MMAYEQRYNPDTFGMDWYDTSNGAAVNWVRPGTGSVTDGGYYGGLWRGASPDSTPNTSRQAELAAKLQAATPFNASVTNSLGWGEPFYRDASGKFIIPFKQSQDSYSGFDNFVPYSYGSGNAGSQAVVDPSYQLAKISGIPDYEYGYLSDTAPKVNYYDTADKGNLWKDGLSQLATFAAIAATAGAAGGAGAAAGGAGAAGAGTAGAGIAGGGGALGAGASLGSLIPGIGSIATGAGVPAAFGGLAGAGALGAAEWGVNSGGNMDWWDDFINSVGENYGTGGSTPGGSYVPPYESGGGLFDLSELPSPTNLQDKITLNDPTNPANFSKLVQKYGLDTAIKLAKGAASGSNGNLLSRLFSGDAGAGDYLSAGGNLASTLLGMYASGQQTNALKQLADRYAGYGAPYRDKLAASYADPAGFLANSPDIQAAVDQGTNAMARSLSTTGNPVGSGNSLQQLQDYATKGLYGQLGNERNRLANFGGLSNFNAASPGFSSQAVASQGNAYNALGSGIASLTNQNPTLADLLKAMQGGNNIFGTT